MAALALLYISAGFFEDYSFGPLNQRNLAPVEVTITLLFVGEFSLRFYLAQSRSGYLRDHWIDLLALLPAIRFLRVLRLARVVYLLPAARTLRLGMLVRFLVQSNRACTRIRSIAAHQGVHVVFLFALGLVVVGGTLVWELEHETNASFQSYGDAIWWAFATMTTVGFGNGPMTLAGRAVAAILMVVGIGCFGVIAATVTTYFLERIRGHEVSSKELMAVLEDVRARLARLEAERHSESRRQ